VVQSLLTGFFVAANGARVRPTVVTVAEPDKVIGAAVTTLLGPEQASPADIRAVAEEGLRLLHEQRALVLASIVHK
jgi:hypothetical protein